MSEHELRRTWLRRSLVVAGGATTLMRVPGWSGKKRRRRRAAKVTKTRMCRLPKT